ncbi:MAG: MATE family efflux transporter [Bacteroidales bacterium]|jgi:putative MATE family efflux protein|nr:MATE family efflux transporter [Bacteroidales bacterium]
MILIKFRRIWEIAYPIVIGSIAQNLLSVTDTAFIGRLDEVSLGATALGGVFYVSVMMLGLGFSIGIQVIVARRRGEGRSDSIGQVLHHALYFMIPFVLLLWMLFRKTGSDILSLLVRSPDVLEATIDFFDMRITGILFGFMLYVCQAFFVGIAQTKFISYVTGLMVVVNIVLDWVMIFGHAGFETMGIRGAALASVISEAVAVVVYVTYIYRRQNFRQYRIFRKLRYVPAEMRNLLKISVPASLQNFLSVASWFIFFIMVEKLGEQALAVSNIGRSLYMLFLLPVWGFASAVNSLVSYSIGCRKPLLTFPIIGKVTALTAVSIIVLEAFAFVFSDFVTAIYTDIPSLIEPTKNVMPAICISALVFGTGFVCFNAVSGTGNTHIALMLEIIATLIYLVITVLAVDSWGWGIIYVWLVDGIYGVVMAAFSLAYLFAGTWMKK